MRRNAPLYMYDGSFRASCVWPSIGRRWWGGFMYLLTKEPNAIENIKAALAQVEVGSAYECTIIIV